MVKLEKSNKQYFTIEVEASICMCQLQLDRNKKIHSHSMSTLVVYVDLTREQINIFTYDFNKHGFCGSDSSNCNQDHAISTLQQPKPPLQRALSWLYPTSFAHPFCGISASRYSWPRNSVRVELHSLANFQESPPVRHLTLL